MQYSLDPDTVVKQLTKRAAIDKFLQATYNFMSKATAEKRIYSRPRLLENE
jgi:hypothetical protein